MGWYNSNWNYRKKVTVDKTKLGGEDQSDFPVYGNLANLGADFFSHVKADGGDIVVTLSDETTKLKRELVSINVGSSIGELHFKAPSLSASADTDFYVYYGNAAGAETNDADTWDANFKLVDHLKDTTTSTTTESVNGATGTKKGVNEPIEATGQIGKGQQFDSVDDRISFDDADALDLTGDITIEAWLNADSAGTQNSKVAAKADAAVPEANYMFAVRADDGWRLEFGLYNGGWAAIYSSANFILTDAWHHYASVWDNTIRKARYLRDGANAELTADYGKTVLADNQPLYLGGLKNGAGITQLFKGIVDEIRISNVKRADSWLLSTFNNHNSPSTFYAVGAEEPYVPPPTPPAEVLPVFWPNKSAPTGYHCFIQQYVKNMFKGRTPFKLPDGTEW